jgi:copper homeostasis protein
MNSVSFELCAESIEAAAAGERGGANRVELCSALDCGGLTPDADLTRAALVSLKIPVHILIRPRNGNFVFSASEFDMMRRQIEHAKQNGASGVAIGVLLPNGQVDVERSRELVELARPMAATFHRAFDETADLHEALEHVIETGATSLLTSGGAADVLSGADFIASLRHQAGGRISMIAGGGLRIEGLPETVRRSGVFSLHGSLSRRNGHSTLEARLKALETDVQEAVSLLQNAYREQRTPLSVT